MSGPKDTRPAPDLRRGEDRREGPGAAAEREIRAWQSDRRRRRDRGDQARAERPRLDPTDYDRVAAVLPREGPGLTATQVAQRLNVNMDDEAQRVRLLAALNHGAQVRVLVTYMRRPGGVPRR